MLSEREEGGEDGMGEDVATSEQQLRRALCKPQFSIQLFLAAVGRRVSCVCIKCSPARPIAKQACPPPTQATLL